MLIFIAMSSAHLTELTDHKIVVKKKSKDAADTLIINFTATEIKQVLRGLT